MNCTVIWIDDEIQTMNDFEPLFNDYGFNIIKCPTLGLGLQKIKDEISFNILLDVNFPNSEKEGMIFLESLFEISPNLRIVIFTGYPNFVDAFNAGSRLGAAAYLQKPIPLSDEAKKIFFNKLHNIFDAKVIDKRTIHAQAKGALENYDMQQFKNALTVVFASIAYSSNVRESFYHAIVQAVLKSVGIEISSEVATNVGRIDAVAITKRFVYFIEFKLNDAVIALKQIKDRQYYQQYLLTTKEIILVGVSFDKKTRNVKDIISEKYKP